MKNVLHSNSDTSSYSNACPNFFRGLVAEARRSPFGYYVAGRELARHARSLTEGDVSDAVLARLDAISDLPVSERGAVVVDWMVDALPRCLAMVPRRSLKGTFLQGVEEAIQEELV
jgi:hypothetical protein